MKQPGFFDYDIVLSELTDSGDPLVGLNAAVDWEAFRGDLERIRKKFRKSNAGRKPYDVVLMFKVLILGGLYNLSDDALEYQLRDRLSFKRFLGLDLGDKVPDAKTIWLFREQLVNAALVKRLFGRFNRILEAQGLTARKGQIIDASLVSVPVQRNTREENQRVREGEVPEEWSEPKRRQKDVEARWTQKNGQNYYGYKNHVCVDVKHKLIRDYAVTDAAVHDSQVFAELLDERNSSRDVWADSAYRSQAHVSLLQERGFREHIQRKGYRGHSLTARELQGNRTRAKTRSRVEHVFGVQARMARDSVVRAIGKARAAAAIGLRNLSYNLFRFSRLCETG